MFIDLSLLSYFLPLSCFPCLHLPTSSTPTPSLLLLASSTIHTQCSWFPTWFTLPQPLHCGASRLPSPMLLPRHSFIHCLPHQCHNCNRPDILPCFPSTFNIVTQCRCPAPTTITTQPESNSLCLRRCVLIIATYSLLFAHSSQCCPHSLVTPMSPQRVSTHTNYFTIALSCCHPASPMYTPLPFHTYYPCTHLSHFIPFLSLLEFRYQTIFI